MPRASRRNKSRRADYGPYDFDYLRSGPHGCLCLLTTAEMTGDEATIEAAWNDCQQHIMRGWFKHHAGTRPWAWWKFIGHKLGRRERIDGKVHPHDNKARSLAVANIDRPDAWRRAYSLRFGMPGIFIPPFDDDIYHDFMANVLHGKESEAFEPEWSFLVRHNLLVPEDSP